LAELEPSNNKKVIHVLHVDDDPSILCISKNILELEGNFKVDNATTVEEAFRKLSEQSYDAVISDYEMPQKNGLDLLKELREQNNQIPFVLFTGKGREEVAIKALNLGADGYFNKQGNPETVYGELTHGIKQSVERVKAEEALRETKEYLDNLLNYANAPIIVWDNEKRITLFNSAFEAFTGLKREQVLGSKIDLLFPPAEKEEILQTIESASKGEMWQSVEIPILCADKETRVALWNSANIQDKNGNIVATIAQGQDITERKTAEEKLKRLKAFDERIIDSLDDALLIIDPDNYKIISANETTLKQLKLKKEDLIGKTCYEATHHTSTPCQPPEHICPIQKVLETRKTITVEHTHFDKSNNVRIMEVSASLVKNPEGKTVVIHVARDITKSKQMETRIREAEKQYHALFSQAPFGILIIDPKTATPIEFNKIAHEQLGYSREEFAKLRIYDYKAIETQAETKDKIAKILEEGSAEFEAKHRTKNGEIRDISITAQAIELSGKTLIHSIYRDVTNSKKVDEALRESETKYRQLVELAQEGVWALDTDNLTVYVNPRMAEMLGYAESEIYGKNLSAFLDNPDINLAQHNLEECKLGNPGQCEFEFTRKGGTRIYASIAASSIQDDTGNNTGTLALVSDITERKKAELSLKESHEKLEMMNEKLRVVGGLTRHDVRNKLCAVMGNAYLIKKKYADQAGILERLDKMELAVKEIEKIFDFAKMYEQLGVEELSFVDVERTVTEAVALFSDLTVKVVNECKGLTLLADSFLRQLFYNFIDNTRKYGKTANTIRVFYEKEENDMLRLIYLDDGVGISVEDKLRLFEEGFSTGGSTGFGLFLSKKMMDVYGWEIKETGEPGKGAKFVITIPKTNQNGKGTYKIQPTA
jgi:PAS domain S-box-containing protein